MVEGEAFERGIVVRPQGRGGSMTAPELPGMEFFSLKEEAHVQDHR
jgi:hypothetical protein